MLFDAFMISAFLWAKEAQVAEVEATKAVALREAELQREVEQMNALMQTEKLKAEFLRKGRNEYETKVQEAIWEQCRKQQAADAYLYEKEKEAQSQKAASEAAYYERKQRVDGDLYAKKKEAEGLSVLAQAQGTYLRTLLDALGGNYLALRDYMEGCTKKLPKSMRRLLAGWGETEQVASRPGCCPQPPSLIIMRQIMRIIKCKLVNFQADTWPAYGDIIFTSTNNQNP